MRHAFGTRASVPPDGLLRVRQVHGCAVARVRSGGLSPEQADAIVSDEAGVAVGIATADCVPILLCRDDARVVAAVHAGWRGLASGVIESALRALADAGAPAERLRAAVGPCIGPCCYEVDAPVLAALGARYPAALPACLEPARPGHARLDLAALAQRALRGAGLGAASVERFAGCCTRCDTGRFHSFRRDGPAAGRMVHWVAAS